MSSHRMSASGDRPFTLNAGGGPYSGYSVPSKQTDALNASISGFSKVEIAGLPLDAVKLERIKYRINTREKDAEPTYAYVLVFGGDGKSVGLSIFGYPSGDSDNPGPENTNFDIRKPDEKFGAFGYYKDDMEVVQSVTLEELLAEETPTAG